MFGERNNTDRYIYDYWVFGGDKGYTLPRNQHPSSTIVETSVFDEIVAAIPTSNPIAQRISSYFVADELRSSLILSLTGQQSYRNCLKNTENSRDSGADSARDDLSNLGHNEGIAVDETRSHTD
ncbi:hypothetical protein EAG_04083 [Camponotus floridanus]|uniref:Uncharacterized protein n=1 Tax=Camponotus floridanus TaxID=104421 RepID=E2AYB8_CAMFO|nr:hypothetical protein EAG_04083 [Camponotus floridanus]